MRMIQPVQLLGVCLLLLASFLTTSCGFHLRGVSHFSFQSIYVAGLENTPWGVAVRRALKNQPNIQVVSDSKEAQVILSLLSERPEKRILSLTVQGLVREYTLYQYVTFEINKQTGQALLAPTTLEAERVISYNENAVLSKAAEESMLYKDMQGDLVQQIVRRLAALKEE